MIAVRCFGTLQEAAFLRADINRLNRSCTRPDPFSSFEFFEAFLQHEDLASPGRAARNLWFLTAFAAGQLVGYLALKQVSHRVLGLETSKVDFLVAHDGDRPHLVASPENGLAVSEAFYGYLLGRRSEWSFLEFRQQDATSQLFPPPTAVNLEGYSVRHWPGMDNGTIHLRWATLVEYFESFSKRFRSNVSRQMRSLLAAGDVEYLESSDPVATPALFELYQSIDRRSWKALPGAAIGRHPQWAGYFEGLLDPGQPMQVSIQLLLLNRIPVAGLITGAFERSLYALDIAFDRSFSQLGPGSAVLLMGMRQAIEGDYDCFNLLSGFGYYKARWRAHMSATRNAQIYRIGTPFFWHRLSGDLRRRMHTVAGEPGPGGYNPARRDVLANSDNSPGTRPQASRLDGLERQRIATLLAEAEKGRCEYLAPAALAAVMPFATGRTTATMAQRLTGQVAPTSWLPAIAGDHPV